MVDALAFGLTDDDNRLRDGGASAPAYADAVSMYLAFALDKVADRGWYGCGRLGPNPDAERDINERSGRQAIPMT